MAFYRAQVALTNDSLLARDLAVCTYHFETSGIGDEQDALDDIGTALAGFYATFDDLLSENLVQVGGRHTKIYNLADEPPRSPVWEEVANLSSLGTTALPNELAVCLSYRGAIESGVNRRRNRGRVFIGPLSGVWPVDSAGDVRPSLTHRTTLADGAGTWLLPVATPTYGGDIAWSVFSRYDALGLAVGAPPPSSEPHYTLGQLANGFRPIVTAWVDDSFDTQRRRGLAPTSRYSVT